MAPALFPAQIFQYRKAAPVKGHLIRTVPFEKWLKVNYCGPACLAMVLNSWERTRPYSQQKIAEEIFDSESQATYNSELLLYPRIKGFESYSFQGSLEILKDLIGKDIPVIVLTKTLKQVAKGHYRVVIGFDDDAGQIIFHDPYFGGRKAMKVKIVPEGLGARKGAQPVPVDDGRGPWPQSFPFPRPSQRPVDLHQPGHGLLPAVGFREIEGAVGKGQGIPRRGPVRPLQPGHGQPETGPARRGGGLGPRSRRPGREKRLRPRRPGPGPGQSREDASGAPVPRPGPPAGPQRKVHPRALSSGQGHLHREGPDRRHPK
ncbi:MAG: C39 family peptidase [Candidatus Moduliflexus flocculans]|nr:C39 family peptidase [Candidatus Moduliflexus flocculans]